MDAPFSRSAPRRRVSRLAITSLAGSLLRAWGLRSTLGIVPGALALRRLSAEESAGCELRGRALAIAGIVLGLVGIGAMVVLIVLAVQVLNGGIVGP